MPLIFHLWTLVWSQMASRNSKKTLDNVGSLFQSNHTSVTAKPMKFLFLLACQNHMNPMWIRPHKELWIFVIIHWLNTLHLTSYLTYTRCDTRRHFPSHWAPPTSSTCHLLRSFFVMLQASLEPFDWINLHKITQQSKKILNASNPWYAHNVGPTSYPAIGNEQIDYSKPHASICTHAK